MPQYYVYIMANRSKTLYVGVTNNLERRVYEHKHSVIEGFTSRYHVTKLVYYETAAEIDPLLGEKSRSRAGCAGRKWH